jgi:hypothetical protein
MKRRLLVTVLLALVFGSPATAANIVVTNTSSLPDAEIVDALPAFQRALDEDFAAVWPVAGGSKLFLGAAPPDAWEIRIVDSPDCVFCAGYHDVDNGVPYAVVSRLDDWQLTFTHELWELLVNPYGDRVAIVQPKQEKRVYALETADPVEAEKFAYPRPSATGRPVRISDFVTPAWFQRGSVGPWDFTRGTKRPLQLLEDGYQVYLKNGAWDAIWAGAAAKVDGRTKAARWNARRATALGRRRPTGAHALRA